MLHFGNHSLLVNLSYLLTSSSALLLWKMARRWKTTKQRSEREEQVDVDDDEDDNDSGGGSGEDEDQDG